MKYRWVFSGGKDRGFFEILTNVFAIFFPTPIFREATIGLAAFIGNQYF
jgi:hypothetical protein